MISVDTGTRAVPENTAPIPTTTKAGTKKWAPGNQPFKTDTTPPPSMAPMYTFGPNTPPDRRKRR